MNEHPSHQTLQSAGKIPRRLLTIGMYSVLCGFFLFFCSFFFLFGSDQGGVIGDFLMVIGTALMLLGTSCTLLAQALFETDKTWRSKLLNIGTYTVLCSILLLSLCLLVSIYISLLPLVIFSTLPLFLGGLRLIFGRQQAQLTNRILNTGLYVLLWGLILTLLIPFAIQWSFSLAGTLQQVYDVVALMGAPFVFFGLLFLVVGGLLFLIGMIRTARSLASPSAKTTPVMTPEARTDTNP